MHKLLLPLPSESKGSEVEKKPWNLSAFPSALEVRRIQRGRTSDVTELPRFHHQEVQCFWVSAVWHGGGGGGGRVDTCKPLLCFQHASHCNGTCWGAGSPGPASSRRFILSINLPSTWVFFWILWRSVASRKYSMTSHNRPKDSVKCQAEYYDFISYVSLANSHKCQILFGADPFHQFILGGSLRTAPAVWRTWH